MAEGRVAHVVGEACRRDNGANLAQQRGRQLRTAADELAGHITAQRHAYARHLERVGQTVVDEDAARKGEDLRLVLHAPERRGEDEAVVVALELRTLVVTLKVTAFLPKAFRGYELLPVHCISYCNCKSKVIFYNKQTFSANFANI